MNIDRDLSAFLIKLGVPAFLANILDIILIIAALIFLAVLLNYIGKTFFINLFKKIVKRTEFRFDDLLIEKNVITYIIHMVPPVLIYILLPFFFEEGRHITSLTRKICVIYLIYSFMMALNGLILVFFDNYSMKRGNSHRPIRGFVQVVQVLLFFIGIIVIISIIINRSPTTLFAGIWASAAVFSLVFKDLIAGFIAGVQLSMNDMVRPGDWVTLSDGKTNGIVQEITLITVKIRNFDNSISTVPPTVLVTNTFQNWREMLESNGRLVSKSVYVDKTSVKFVSADLLDKLKTTYPLVRNFQPVNNDQPTNTDVFRFYIENYLQQRPDVNPDMGLKVGEMETTDRGLPIQLYFFSRNKEDKEFEQIQSEVYSHATAVLPDFELVVK